MKTIVLRVQVLVDEAIDDSQMVEFLEEELLDAINIVTYEVTVVSSEEVTSG